MAPQQEADTGLTKLHSTPDTPNQPSSEQPFLMFTDVPTPELQTFISPGLPKSQSSSQVTHPIPQPPTIFDFLKRALVELLLEVLHFLHAFIFIFVVIVALLGILGLVFDWPNELLREIWERTSVKGTLDVVRGVGMRFLDV